MTYTQESVKQTMQCACGQKPPSIESYRLQDYCFIVFLKV